MSESAIYRYWGKAGEDDRFHLLPYHCLDVAACGVALLESHRPLRELLSARLDLDVLQLFAWLSFFMALHDLGKFSHGFQGLRSDLFERLQPGRTHGNYSVRHDSLGWSLWNEALADGPQLLVLEDVTGAGKTEAALMLAQRLLASGLGDGLYIALPTMATSNAMFRRIAEKRLDSRLFSGEPGLVLAHSAARLVERPNRRAEALPTGSAEMDYADDEASVGSSVLLLSATLPKAARQSLADSFRKGLGQPAVSLQEEAYPLLTLVTGNETRELPLDTRLEVVRSVRVERIGERQAVLDRLIEAHRAGQCACWVRNSVSDAIEAWRELAAAGVAEARLHLFHARFALGDRLAIETDALDRFGPNSGPGERRGHILVATQVVEQSLDLDFDFMVSDLAPVDLLIQRAGRLRRHRRDPDGRLAEREGRGEPVLCVFAPEPCADAGEDWLKPLLPATAAVYPDLGQLWRTARLLDRFGRIAMPSDARDLIEAVFGPEPEATPQELALVSTRLEGERQANRSIGRFNALDLADGYRSQTDYWDDIHTPTRLGDARVRVRLARWRDDQLMPWCDDPRHPWPMSEINVREAWIAQEAEPSDPALQKAVEDYRETVFDKGRWSKLLILESAEGGGWEGEAIDGRGRRTRFRYEVETGLSKTE